VALGQDIVSALAAELEGAEQTHVQIGHFSARYPEMAITDGYAIQRAWMALKLAKGRKPIGHKIGLTSRAMQRASNISEPDYGLLLDDMLFPDGQDLPFDRFIEPRVEVELAFILKGKLEGPSITLFDVLNATDYVVPAIEIIDARIRRLDPTTNQLRSVLDTISDNAANAGIVMGGRPIKPDAIDLRWVGALMHRNGVIEETGLAAAVLNHPANGVAWLAKRLAPYGECLDAGEIVLAGSFTAPQHASRGDSFHVDYGPLGSISVRFQ
jgi:2-oxo-hept-3-ene-1,7-dioate hydratase